MKKICITLEIIIIIFLTIACNVGGTTAENSEYLRIHVRANSNSQTDQDIKYLVRDEIVSLLTPSLADCPSKREAVNVINRKKRDLENSIDELLKRKGFSYSSKVSVRNEKFPTRVYEDLTLESGYYDAVIVELGKAEGNNWWCVVYPPMCFAAGEKVAYKSKIKEIIDEFKASRTK